MADQTRRSRPGRPSPPGPPAGSSEGMRLDLLLLLAQRLHGDHRVGGPRADPAFVPAVPVDGTWVTEPGSREVCQACGQPWPCSGRRLAELAMVGLR